MTPIGLSWNPHLEHFSLNEDSYIDWNGEIVQQHHHVTTLIDEENIKLDIESVIGMCNDVKVQVHRSLELKNPSA